MITEYAFKCCCCNSNIMVTLKTYVSVCAQELGGPSLGVDTKVWHNTVWKQPELKRLHLLAFFHLAEQKPI